MLSLFAKDPPHQRPGLICIPDEHLDRSKSTRCPLVYYFLVSIVTLYLGSWLNAGLTTSALILNIRSDFRSRIDALLCIRFVVKLRPTPKTVETMCSWSRLNLKTFPHHFWIVHTTWISVHEINNYPHTLLSSLPQSQLQFFPSLKQNLMFVFCPMPLLLPRPLTICTTWRRVSRHAQRGALRCCQITDEVWANGWHAMHHRWHFYLGQNKISCII